MRKVLRRLILLAVVACVVVGCAQFGSPVAERENPTKATAVRRNIREVRRKLMGKTTDEVVRMVGTPDRMNASGEREWWSYEDRFYDPITERNLKQVRLIFYQGKVEDVTFY